MIVDSEDSLHFYDNHDGLFKASGSFPGFPPVSHLIFNSSASSIFGMTLSEGQVNVYELANRTTLSLLQTLDSGFYPYKMMVTGNMEFLALRDSVQTHLYQQKDQQFEKAFEWPSDEFCISHEYLLIYDRYYDRQFSTYEDLLRVYKFGGQGQKDWELVHKIGLSRHVSGISISSNNQLMGLETSSSTEVYDGLSADSVALIQTVEECSNPSFADEGRLLFCENGNGGLTVWALSPSAMPVWMIVVLVLANLLLLHMVPLVGWILRRRQLRRRVKGKDQRRAELMEQIQSSKELVLERDCPICLGEGSGCFLPCMHAFHSECIGEWLARGRRKCPVCRSGVQAQDLVEVD